MVTLCLLQFYDDLMPNILLYFICMRIESSRLVSIASKPTASYIALLFLASGVLFHLACLSREIIAVYCVVFKEEVYKRSAKKKSFFTP